MSADFSPIEPTPCPRRAIIRSDLLATSRTIQSPAFLRADAADLRRLFDGYDRQFFAGALAAALRSPAGGPIEFEWSNRLRSSGGVTTRWRRFGGLHFRIAISRPLMFDNFRNDSATIVGLPCADRLDGLMRVFEHELIHLHEFLSFGRSNCARPRFQRFAAAHFGHVAHRHALTTPRQRTLAATTIRPGTAVTFVHDGRSLSGRVNRINKRATVLVPSDRGVPYTDGKRYLKFYVPPAKLRET